MQFARRDDLAQVMCPLADTAVPDPKTGRPQPQRAGLVFVRRLRDPDRDVLVEHLDDDWGERVKWIFAECVCDENGIPPTPEVLADFFSRLDLRTTELVHRTCCAWNGIPYLPYLDERHPADQSA